MRYIQTFESYLKGGRQPLYHWTPKLMMVLKEDTLKRGTPSRDKHMRGRNHKDQIKSISVTRSPNFSWVGRNRLMLDADLLKKDGYVVEPFDEIGYALTLNKFPKDSKHTFPIKGLKKVPNDVLDVEQQYMLDEEHEERIYSDIENVGKYIIEIQSTTDGDLDILSEYIKKYPHIKYTKIKEMKGYPSSVTEVILDIEKVRKMEKEKELVS